MLTILVMEVLRVWRKGVKLREYVIFREFKRNGFERNLGHKKWVKCLKNGYIYVRHASVVKESYCSDCGG